MLMINNISVAYDKKVVINNINIQVQTGKILCIVGESGSGKTTLMKTIMGILPQDAKIVSGDILHDDKSMIEMSPADRSKLCAMVFQDAGFSLNPIRKIGKQFVQYILTHKDMKKEQAHDLAVSMLESMNLQDGKHIMNSYIFELSGGMRQRVGLAMALSLNPSILLLDEPTSALDVTTQSQVVEEILQMQKRYNSTVVMITHNIMLALYIADYVVVMQNGNIVEQNSAEQIFNNPQHKYTKRLLEG
ncbi:MAG: hypothetical protein ATN35_03220 [Epulopiscium sp. Nele67-Bin004]|nr:MAG: hypothetical protein ATN35_03220 [Epulopiscium sp. Nele67-Bin004]